MTDRSAIMRAVRSTNTGPEKIVRRLVSTLGFRYRLHAKRLPGKPDLVFPSQRKIIFVHGCFWHGHRCKRGARVPKANRKYWIDKITRNKARDTKQMKSLKSAGWTVYTVWECKTRKPIALRATLGKFLKDRNQRAYL